MIEEKLEKILLNVQKPARYIGGEQGSVVKDPSKVSIRFAMCFPDLYEVGMSHLGMKILYSLKNEQPDVWCERVFAPDLDMEAEMRREGIPLYGLESLEPVRRFDFLGFTLQYEMCYPTILNMLDLAGIPVWAKDRGEEEPIIAAGGPCACNPEPIADFFDLFVLGEGEEVNLELIDLYRTKKREGWSRREFLLRAARIPGIYVPAFYEVAYGEDGCIRAVAPVVPEAAPVVTKRIIADLDKVYYPKNFVVPYMEIVHDRAMVEVLRGCIRGCRFCQAGFIYRPFREKEPDTLNENAHTLCRNTGYDEVSLTSLSTSDYSRLEALLEKMLPWSGEEKTNLSLPSLRVDGFSEELAEKIAQVRKSGLTFAPEAGTQRMRDVINKNLTEEEIFSTCRAAFAGGYTAVKLYFMMGQPTETDEDIEGIVQLAQRIVNLYYSMPERPKGKSVTVTCSVACFVPKPFTPFQFEAQDTVEELRRKQKHLLDTPHSKKIQLKYHDASTSVLEGVLARGDRRLAPVIYAAWRAGSKLDADDRYFDLARWEQAFAACGIDPAFYANRRREYGEVLPWDHLDFGVDKAFLIREDEKAHRDAVTLNCREGCSACGAQKLTGGNCLVRR